MTSKNVPWPRDHSEANPKINPAPQSNAEKEPDDWVSGDDPMTGAQPGLSKAEASKRIDALKAKRRQAQQR